MPRGVDLMSCPFDSPVAQARLPEIVAAAPTAFISGSTPHGMASGEEAIRTGFRALELGASSVYCSGSPAIVEAMAAEGIPVVGHIGFVPRHATWTGVRAIGKTAEEATEIFLKMKALENAGAYAAEIELVPHQLAEFLSKKTTMLLMSLGSGDGCDTQFLFFRRHSGVTTTSEFRGTPRRTGIFARNTNDFRKSGSLLSRSTFPM